jgi:hypothetical protein
LPSARWWSALPSEGEHSLGMGPPRFDRVAEVRIGRDRSVGG